MLTGMRYISTIILTFKLYNIPPLLNILHFRLNDIIKFQIKWCYKKLQVVTFIANMHIYLYQ